MDPFSRLLSLAGGLMVAGLVFLAPGRTEAATNNYELHLVGAEENPAVTNDPANATATFAFDDATKTLTWSLTIAGVSPDLITGAHIHRGAVGINGPIIYPLTTGGGPTTTGKITLTDADATDLMAGNLYTNIHTAAHPGGAARAQLVLPLAHLHQQQIDATNRGDLATTMSYFADNAVFSSGGCTPIACQGKAAIQNELQQEIAAHVHVTILSAKASGNTLTEYGEVSLDPFIAAGISRVRFTFITTFSGNKIVSITGQPDITDPQTVAYLQASAPPAFRPPNTGDAGLLDGLVGTASWPLHEE